MKRVTVLLLSAAAIGCSPSPAPPAAQPRATAPVPPATASAPLDAGSAAFDAGSAAPDDAAAAEPPIAARGWTLEMDETKGAGRRVAFAPSGRTWAALSYDALHVWDHKTSKRSVTVDSSPHATSVRFTKDGRRVHAGPNVIDLASGARLDRGKVDPWAGSGGSRSHGDSYEIEEYDAWPDAGVLAAIARFHDRNKCLNDPCGGLPVHRPTRVLFFREPAHVFMGALAEREAEVDAIALGPTSVVTAPDGTVWDVAGKRAIGKVGAARAMRYSPDGTRLLVATPESDLVLFDAASWKELARARTDLQGEFVAFSGKSNVAAVASSASKRSTVALWSFAGNAPSRAGEVTLRGAVVHVDVSAAGDLFAVAWTPVGTTETRVSLFARTP
jgi:hypothetical protein